MEITYDVVAQVKRRINFKIKKPRMEIIHAGFFIEFISSLPDTSLQS